jgi:CYTH domain-containing protein/CHAD domain-containing protein
VSKEIERKYLVQSTSWRQQVQASTPLRQGYLSTAPERSVRIRQEGGHAVITIKGEQKGQTRAEFEYPIPLEDANELLQTLCIQPLISKTRHKLQVGSLTWTIDEFDGDNQPLILAEVETPDEQPPIALPDWVGKEVTDDLRYANINLVAHPYNQWADEADESEEKTKFHLKRSESVAQGLRRIVTEEIEAALAHLSRYEATPDKAIHETRKSIKRLRALLRIMRPVLGKVFADENETLGEVGRTLSTVRDAQALMETLDHLTVAYSEQLPPAGLPKLRQMLLNHKQAQAEQLAGKQQLPRLIATLQQTLKRAYSWPYKAMDIELLAEGVAHSVRRGRAQSAAAYDQPDDETFHTWRKRAKDLRYQLTLLQKLWPEVFAGYLESAKTVEELLGLDHNLVVLRDTLRNEDNSKEVNEESQQLLPLLDQEQQRIRHEAKFIGARLYSEKPGQWRRRIEQSWHAWKKEKK